MLFASSMQKLVHSYERAPLIEEIRATVGEFDGIASPSAA